MRVAATAATTEISFKISFRFMCVFSFCVVLQRTGVPAGARINVGRWKKAVLQPLFPDALCSRRHCSTFNVEHYCYYGKSGSAVAHLQWHCARKANTTKKKLEKIKKRNETGKPKKISKRKNFLFHDLLHWRCLEWNCGRRRSHTINDFRFASFRCSVATTAAATAAARQIGFCKMFRFDRFVFISAIHFFLRGENMHFSVSFFAYRVLENVTMAHMLTNFNPFGKWCTVCYLTTTTGKRDKVKLDFRPKFHRRNIKVLRKILHNQYVRFVRMNEIAWCNSSSPFCIIH